jgi:hypothetical protein
MGNAELTLVEMIRYMIFRKKKSGGRRRSKKKNMQKAA